jgi:predicted RNA-binding Zn-ribbon protein involved in translation (DUF1610 family)
MLTMKEEKSTPPEQVMASLFEGRARLDQMALLARLEHGGASIYRAWASAERNVKAREALLAAAEREEANAKLLRLMSTPKGECEKCQAPLALGAEAVSYAFQCTFCPACGTAYNHVCPNCGGELTQRRAA